jgi:hypothetical protein
MTAVVKKLFEAWDRFWFSPIPLAPLNLMRWFLGLTLFTLYIQRQWGTEIFFGNKAVIPSDVALEMLPEFNRPPWLLLQGLDAWSFSLHLIFLAGLLLFAFGVGGRFLAFGVWLLHVAFIQRNYAVAFGADLIGGIFLFYLALAGSSKGMSLQELFKRGFKKSWESSWERSTGIFGSVFFRLMQVQLCVIYVYTGLEKLKGSSWWDGTALWTVLANPQMAMLDLTWLRWFAPLLVAATFMTVLFEIYFPVLIWFKNWRKSLLIMGAIFHIGIGLSMGLFAFAAVMMSSYCLFLMKTDFQFKSSGR